MLFDVRKIKKVRLMSQNLEKSLVRKLKTSAMKIVDSIQRTERMNQKLWYSPVIRTGSGWRCRLPQISGGLGRRMLIQIDRQ